jgi:hypothetical protein
MRLLYLVVCEEACHHLLLARRLAKGSVNRLVGQSTTHIIDFSRQMCLPTCREMDIDTVLLIEPITEYRLIRRTVTIIGLGLQMLCVKHLPECKIIRLAKGACWDDPFFLLDFSKSSTTHDKPHPSKTWQGQQYRHSSFQVVETRPCCGGAANSQTLSHLQGNRYDVMVWSNDDQWLAVHMGGKAI